MEIRVVPTALGGVVIVETAFVRDERGFLIESYHQQRYAAHGFAEPFVQDNHSHSRGGVLRGIHYQDLSAPMAKLVRCTGGRVFDVAVDLRAGSSSFGRWIGVELSAENMKQLFVPVGFGHAFLTLSDAADVQYRCTNYYTPSAEGCLAWNDPDIGIEWPLRGAPVMSARDANGMSLRTYLQKPAFHHPVRC
jgi:dTDP-4-dehydrorhamnose 3,5-epimerase